MSSGFHGFQQNVTQRLRCDFRTSSARVRCLRTAYVSLVHSITAIAWMKHGELPTDGCWLDVTPPDAHSLG